MSERYTTVVAYLSKGGSYDHMWIKDRREDICKYVDETTEFVLEGDVDVEVDVISSIGRNRQSLGKVVVDKDGTVKIVSTFLPGLPMTPDWGYSINIVADVYGAVGTHAKRAKIHKLVIDLSDSRFEGNRKTRSGYAYIEESSESAESEYVLDKANDRTIPLVSEHDHDDRFAGIAYSNFYSPDFWKQIVPSNDRKKYVGTVLYFDKKQFDGTKIKREHLMYLQNDHVPVFYYSQKLGYAKTWYDVIKNSLDCEIIFDEEPAPDKINVGGFYEIKGNPGPGYLRLTQILINGQHTQFKDTYVIRQAAKYAATNKEEEEMVAIKNVKYFESTDKKTGAPTQTVVVEFVDGTKTTSRTVKGDYPDWEKGLAMCIVKRAYRQNPSKDVPELFKSNDPHVKLAHDSLKRDSKTYIKETAAIKEAKAKYQKERRQFNKWVKQGGAMFGTREYDVVGDPVKNIPQRTVELRTAGAVAELYGVSEKQICKWCRQGEIPAAKKTTIRINKQNKTTFLVPVFVKEV